MASKSVKVNQNRRSKRIRTGNVDEESQETVTSSSSNSGQVKQHKYKQPKLSLSAKKVPFKNPLEIPEILQLIFQYLDSTCLKSSRRVNQCWNQNASKTLVDSPNICVDIDLLERKENDELYDFLQYPDPPSASHLLFQNFRMRSTNLFNEVFYYFLNDRGHTMKRLYLKCDQVLDYVSQRMISYLRSVLTKQAINLQYLHIELSNHMVAVNYSFSKKKPSKLFPITWTTELPHLTKLHITNVQLLHIGKEIIQEILEAAINLKEFEATASQQVAASWGCRCITVDYIDQLLTTNRMNSIKKVALAPSAFGDAIDEDEDETRLTDIGYTKMWRLKKFAMTNNPPPLKHLLIHLDEIYGVKRLYKDFIPILKRVLDSSKDSLEDIELEPLEFLTNLSIPVMTKVRRLSLRGRGCIEQSKLKLFPKQRNIYEIFPNLKEIILNEELNYENIEYLFSMEVTVQTVQKLTIQMQMWPIDKFFGILNNTFENLKKLVITPEPCRRDLVQVLKGVIKYFKKLQFIQLTNFWIDCEDKQILQKQILQLDSVIVGIDLNDGRVRRNRNSDCKKGNGQAKVSSLLGGIPDLRCLKMTLKVGKWSEFYENSRTLTNAIFSRAVEQFRIIPQVQIELLGDITEGDFGICSSTDFYAGPLEPLATLLKHSHPYVEIKLGEFKTKVQ